MARKPSVDVSKVLEMLQAGMSTAAVAEHFSVSRQAIDLHRRKFIHEGLIAEERAPRGSAKERPAHPNPSNLSFGANSLPETPIAEPSMVKEYSADPVKPRSSKPASPAPPVPLDRMVEVMIQAFESLKRTPLLEAELAQCRRDLAQAQEKIRTLEEEMNKRRELEARWQQAASRMPSDTPPDNMWKKLY